MARQKIVTAIFELYGIYYGGSLRKMQSYSEWCLRTFFLLNPQNILWTWLSVCYTTSSVFG